MYKFTHFHCIIREKSPNVLLGMYILPESPPLVGGERIKGYGNKVKRIKQFSNRKLDKWKEKFKVIV